MCRRRARLVRRDPHGPAEVDQRAAARGAPSDRACAGAARAASAASSRVNGRGGRSSTDADRHEVGRQPRLRCGRRRASAAHAAPPRWRRRPRGGGRAAGCASPRARRSRRRAAARWRGRAAPQGSGRPASIPSYLIGELLRRGGRGLGHLRLQGGPTTAILAPWPVARCRQAARERDAPDPRAGLDQRLVDVGERPPAGEARHLLVAVAGDLEGEVGALAVGECWPGRGGPRAPRARRRASAGRR